MKKIILTGNIAAGKTTISKIFIKMGMPFYNVDDACKRLIKDNISLRSELIDLFGIKAFLIDVTYNSKYVLSIITSDIKIKKQLENIVGNYLLHDLSEWLKNYKEDPYVLIECAYIFEVELYFLYDYTIGVYCSFDTRLARLMTRDHSLREDAIKKMMMQMDQEEKMDKCNFKINSEISVIPQITSIMNNIFLKDN